MKIRISKTPQQRGPVQIPTPVPMPALLPPAVPTQSRMTPVEGVATIAEPEAAPKAEPPKTKLLEVKSPMVGTYYSAPEPGAKPYVAVGSRIAKGQILCIIEAMKIMNEIESEFSGVVTEVAVQDAHPVEYGQVLFRIDPNG
jgi:acetyl-CoA carboxylase biotin carboxyl carrier protein